jgi:hypothetical protein
MTRRGLFHTLLALLVGSRVRSERSPMIGRIIPVPDHLQARFNGCTHTWVAPGKTMSWE